MFACVSVAEKTSFSLIFSSMRGTTQSGHVCSPSSHSASVLSIQTGDLWSRLINTSASVESYASDQSYLCL